MNLEELKKRHEKSISQYLEAFCDKQELDFDFWVGDHVGGIAHFGDIVFYDFMDIKYDIDTKQPKGLIWLWAMVNMDDKAAHCNYISYCMGYRGSKES